MRTFRLEERQVEVVGDVESSGVRASARDAQLDDAERVCDVIGVDGGHVDGLGARVLGARAVRREVDEHSAGDHWPRERQLRRAGYG